MTPKGEGKLAMQLVQLQEQIGRGEYQVNTQAVADAIVRRLVQERKEPDLQPKRPQGECS
ncbi:MAG TPA: hypothetical protein VGL51_07170 [Solirubrobacteraceae bacterium]|jgi:hypothetical protein